MEEKEETL